MTIIYSNTVVDGLEGSYIEPFRFNGVERGVKKVYTDDNVIAEAYKDKNVEVEAITKQKKQSKKVL